MSIEGELLRLAREREAATEDAVNRMLLDTPDSVRRQLRAYLSRQVDCGRMKRTNEKIPRLAANEGGLNQLACPEVQFSSGARLTFDHNCPAITRTESIVWRNRVNRFGSRVAEVPVKWAFSQKASRSKSVESGKG